MKPELRLAKAWLENCYNALCREVPGGVVAQCAKGPGGVERLLVVANEERRQLAEAEAERLFSAEFAVRSLGDEGFSVDVVLGELQSFLLEPGSEVTGEDASLLAFLLRETEYRSERVPVARVVYHVTPHGDGWKLKRRGTDEERLFSNKEEAVKAGARTARAHAEGQLIIHKADGRFEEERTYGGDPRGEAG